MGRPGGLTGTRPATARAGAWRGAGPSRLRPAVPVVVLSGAPDIDEDMLRRMGADDVLRKSASDGELLDAVGRHCRPESG